MAGQKEQPVTKKKRKVPPAAILVAAERIIDRAEALATEDEKAKRPVGRPPLDRDRIMPAACAMISEGYLVSEAAEAEGVNAETIRAWALLPEFSSLYAEARANQCHAFSEQALRIADGTDAVSQRRMEAIVESIATADDEDKDRLLQALTYVAVQRDRLRLDVRKWYTAKVYPKVFGEKVQNEHTGRDGKPLEVVVRVVAEGRRITAG